MSTSGTMKEEAPRTVPSMDGWVCTGCSGVFSLARKPWTHDGVQRCDGCVEREDLHRRLDQAHARASAMDDDRTRSAGGGREERYRRALDEIQQLLNPDAEAFGGTLASIRLTRVQSIVGAALAIPMAAGGGG